MASPVAPLPPSIAPIQAAIRRLAWRVRAQRAMSFAVTTAAFSTLGLMVALTLYKTGWLPLEGLQQVALGVGALIGLSAIIGAVMRLDPIALAQRIDISHDLHDRLSSALSFAASETHDEFTAAQIEDALRFVDQIKLKRAAPTRRPADLWTLLACLLALIALYAMPMPSHQHPLPAQPVFERARVLDSATIALERDRLEALRDRLEGTPDPEMQAVLEELELLLDAAEDRTISEREFLERLDKIDDKLKALQDQSARTAAMNDVVQDKLKEVAEAMEADKEVAKILKNQEEARDLIAALKNKDMAGASEAMARLADKLLDSDKLKDKDLEELATLMEKLSDKLNLDDPKVRDLIKKHEDTLAKLAQKFDKQKKLSDKDQQLLDRSKDELEKLKRESAERMDSQAGRQLKQLQRETKKMSEQIRDKGEKNPTKRGEAAMRERSGKQSEQGQQQGQQGEQQKQDGQKQEGQQGQQQQGQQPQQGQQQGQQQQQQGQQQGQQGQQQGQQRSPQQQAADAAREAARQMREQGQQGQQKQNRADAQRQVDQMREAMKRDGNPNQGGQQDDQRQEQIKDFMRRSGKQEQEGRQGQPGKEGEDGKEGKRGQKEQGQQGKEGQQPGQAGEGQPQNQEGKGQQEGQPNPDAKPSDKPGQGAGDRNLGEESQLDTRREDSKVDASRQSAQGQSRSEIIKGASEQGFASRSYKEVYGDYSSVVEEVMEKDNVPKGYRFYIKRYFQLIQPREQQ